MKLKLKPLVGGGRICVHSLRSRASSTTLCTRITSVILSWVCNISVCNISFHEHKKIPNQNGVWVKEGLIISYVCPVGVKQLVAVCFINNYLWMYNSLFRVVVAVVVVVIF